MHTLYTYLLRPKINIKWTSFELNQVVLIDQEEMCARNMLKKVKNC